MRVPRGGLPGAVQAPQRRGDRKLSPQGAALRLRGQRQSRGSGHRAHGADGNRRSDFAHRPAADRAGRHAGARRPAGPLILYAIPTPLGGAAVDALPPAALQTIRTLKDFAVENAKSARAFLGGLGMPVRELNIEVLGEDVSIHLKGRDLGLLSEAGCPAIADPGAKLIEAAHAKGYRVVPLVGPS